MKAFYFNTEERKLRYGDNRRISVGTTHSVECTPKCCSQGLHASKRLFDALMYAPGSILYLVAVSGDVDENWDKISGKSRKYLAEFAAEDLLGEFARKQALINIEKIKPYCMDRDYGLILKWLTTGDTSVRSAARGAARGAARSAARGAAESAAWSAAWSAAESAAWSAARSAAESAARGAAESAARGAANEMLTDMVRQATGWDI